MIKKKQVIAVASVVCLIAISLSILQVYAAWTVDDLVDWMERIGKNRIKTTNRKVKETRELMGQGLVGEVIKGKTTTLGDEREIMLWEWEPPSDNPKKVSFWVDLEDTRDGDTLRIYVHYAADIDRPYSSDWVEDTPSRKFYWSFNDHQDNPGKLIIDELPVATTLTVWARGSTVEIPWHAIIEEL